MPHWKRVLMDLAEVVDAWRVVPRSLLLAYGVFSLWFIHWIVSWYMHLPAIERTAAETSFITGVIGAVLTAGTWYANVYTSSGKKWTAGSDSGV